jgi:DNA repair ATPase RecN
MLAELRIRIWPSSSGWIEFAPGFNVLTSETKRASIIIDAVGLLLGDRAPRDGTSQAHTRLKRFG